ncbi:hypothetical protein A3Q56_03609 [Intoshia linei]|uniref:Uncharacterized protein n=1 Tax=Intoshia linei TaxID=1819745 RepID=A0A177B2Z1_9BILA|nr:hypothetical protein A3Q56_03609 [Intoshia linei]
MVYGKTMTMPISNLNQIIRAKINNNADLHKTKHNIRVKKNHDKMVPHKPSHHYCNYEKNLPMLSKQQMPYRSRSNKPIENDPKITIINPLLSRRNRNPTLPPRLHDYVTFSTGEE